jgi:hypothetical protein
MKLFVKKIKSKYIWKQKEKLFLKFLSNNDLKVNNKQKRVVGVFISSWFKTFIPWYSITIGLLLKQFYNKRVVFIIDDFSFSSEELNPKYQIVSIIKIAQYLEKYNEVIYLSKQRDKELDISLIDNYAYHNTLHDIRTEQFDESNEYFKLVKKQLTKSSAKLESLFEKFNFEYIFAPGGLCFLTGILHELSKQEGVRFCSYDSGMKGTFLLSANGVAAHLDDVPKAVDMLLHKNNKIKIDDIVRDVQQMINDRFQGKDVFSIQMEQADASRDYSNSILLPLNVNWDSAALNKHIIFKSMIEWILETTEWILQNTTKKIIIRQHPAERFNYASGFDDYGQILEKIFGINDRVVFIKADDKANTYDMLKQTDLVVTHTSTVATEAIIYGKNVVTISNAYYSKMDYVYTPKSKREYFNTIEKLLTKNLDIEKDVKFKAIMSYYVSQCLNWLFPEFLPSTNVDFWFCKTIGEIYNMKGTKEILKAIDSDIPLSIIQWRKLIDSKDCKIL